MKKICALLSLLACSLLILPVIARAGDLKIAPYYNFTLGEGIAVPSVSDWMFSLNLTGDIGLIVQPDDRNRFVGFYELKYTGPGLRRQEGQQFSDRLMDHVIVFRHHYALSDEYTLKSQIDYMNEFKRSGSNEMWGQGIYDFDRYGGGVTLQRKFSNDLTGSVSQQVHYLKFPNYTDLLSLYKSSATAITDSSEGIQDHMAYKTDVTAQYGLYRFNAGFLLMQYVKQKVVTDTAQSNGFFYSNDLQRDMVISLGAERRVALTRALAIAPSVALKLKSSNQNYLHYSMTSSSVPAQYFGNYYDYQEVTLAMPFSLLLSEKWELALTPEWDFKQYTSRPPRVARDKFVDGNQYNNLMIVQLGFILKPNPVTRTQFYYTYQNQSSNMRYEAVLPYNYSAHAFGVQFNYSY